MRYEILSILLVSLVLLGIGTVVADSAYPLNWGEDNATEANETYEPDQTGLDPGTAEVPALPALGIFFLGGSLAALALRRMR